MRYTRRQYGLMLIACLAGVAGTVGVLVNEAKWSAVLALWLLVATFGAVLDTRQQVRQVAQRARRIHQKLDRLTHLTARAGARRDEGPAKSWQTTLDSRQRRLLAAIESLRLDLADDRKELLSRDASVRQELLESAKELERVVGAHADRLAEEIQQGDGLARTQIQQMEQDLIQQTQALLELRMARDGLRPMPLAGGWAMAPSTILHIIELVARERPRLVLELGSGTSTAWLKVALEREPDARLVSLDHVEKFADVTKQHVRRMGGTDNWEVRAAPLEDVEIGGTTFRWYAQELFADLGDIDMLIVDGPPKATGPAARYPAFPALRTRLAPGALIVLDDTHRDDEKRTVQAWIDHGDLEVAEVGMWPGRHTVLRYVPSRPGA